MTKITHENLLEAGFTQKTKTISGETFPTSTYQLNQWVPVPTIEWERESRAFDPVLQIEGMQFRIRDSEQLQKVIQVIVPKFCDPR